MADTVVKTKLVVDDEGSTATLAGLKAQFGQLSGARDHTQKGMEWLSSTLSTMAGVHLPNVIGRMFAFSKSLLDAAAAGDADDQALAGMIATMQSIPWTHARAQAEGLGDDLDDIAMRTSQLTGDIGAAFSALVEIGGASEEALAKSKRDLEQMAVVANVLGKPTAQIAQEFAFMAEGVVKTKGQLFQILKGTGIFGEDMKKAAGEWSKITDEDRARLLAYGLDQVSGKLAKATPVYGDLINQLMNVTDIAKEKLGEPILRAVIPELRRLVGWVAEGRDEIAAFAETMSEDVGKWVREAANEIRYGFQWLQSNQEDIGKTIVEAWTFAREVIAFAVRNKEAIALVVGARAIAGSQGIVGGVQGAVGAGKGIYNMGAAGTTVGGASLAGAAGGAAALGAFAAAIAGVAAAAWQGSELMNDLSTEQKADVRARYEFFQSALESGKDDFRAWSAAAAEHFDAAKAKFMAEADMLGLSRKAAEDMAEAVRDQHEANRLMVSNAERSAQELLAIQQRQEGFVDVEEQNALIGAITSQYQGALDAQNQGAARYISSILVKSKELQTAFLQSADLTAEGFRALSEMVATDAGDFALALKELAGVAEKKERAAATSQVPRVQFNGGQTFKVQQDFRDQDPDRVAVVFQRDILAAAEHRYQSSYTSPFGT